MDKSFARWDRHGIGIFPTDSSLPHHRFFINFPLKKFDSSKERGRMDDPDSTAREGQRRSARTQSYFK